MSKKHLIDLPLFEKMIKKSGLNRDQVENKIKNSYVAKYSCDKLVAQIAYANELGIKTTKKEGKLSVAQKEQLKEIRNTHTASRININNIKGNNNIVGNNNNAR